jgi:hypothetical protein
LATSLAVTKPIYSSILSENKDRKLYALAIVDLISSFMSLAFNFLLLLISKCTKMRIISYNVNGTAAISKGFISCCSKQTDVICLQEIKATPEQIPLLDFELLVTLITGFLQPRKDIVDTALSNQT